MLLDDPALNIRFETALDVAFLKGLHRSTCDDLSNLGLPDAMLDNLVAMQFRAQQVSYRNRFPHAEYYVIEKMGEPIGAMTIDNGTDTIRLVNLAFLPHARNRGYGRCLMRALQSLASDENKALALSVAPQNLPAMHLYLSSGFQAAGGDGVNMEMRWSGG